MSTAELKPYQGNCHCGAVKFMVNFPEVKTVTSCNCSICSKKAYLWLFPDEGQLKFERGEDTLTSYEFAGKNMTHKFCPKCGTAVMAVGKSMGVGVNVRTLMDVDPYSLELKKYDGLTIHGPEYIHPKFTGELPKIEGEGLKLYTGSCHCGAVTIAVKTKPLPEVKVKEDNCSICQRNGYTLIYPQTAQVSIIGTDHTTAYEFGRKFSEHHFCSTCGIPLYMKIKGPPKELFDTWSEARKEAVRGNFDLLPINIRILDGVEWEDLKIERSPEGTEGYSVE